MWRSWGTLPRDGAGVPPPPPHAPPPPRAPRPFGRLGEALLDLTCRCGVLGAGTAACLPPGWKLGPRYRVSSSSLSCSARGRAGLGDEKGMARPSSKAGQGGVGRDRNPRAGDRRGAPRRPGRPQGETARARRTQVGEMSVRGEGLASTATWPAKRSSLLLRFC